MLMDALESMLSQHKRLFTFDLPPPPAINPSRPGVSQWLAEFDQVLDGLALR
ncbi:hypothetical protein ACI2KE_15650 [Pseudomonas monteilii]